MEKYTTDRLHIVKMCIIPNDLYIKYPRSFQIKLIIIITLQKSRVAQNDL